MNLPEEFILRMQKFFANPVERADFFDSFALRRHFGIRINRLKVSVENFAAFFGNIEPVSWCTDGFYYLDSQPPSRNPLYHAGLYYIQEPSAMSAAAILNPQPGDKVLDLCASPGGKSTQIASALNGEGLLVANDVNYGRMPQLVRNIEMAGVKNAIILCETPARLATRFPVYFDKILVDAPCSGEGMFRKDPEAIISWDRNKSARLAVIQKEILRDAAKMLAIGGYLAYSTCTFSPTENEDVINDFLEQNPDFESVCINHEHFGVSPANMGLVTDNVHAARIWPHKHRGEGHFVALLHKSRGGTLPPDFSQQPLPKFDSKYFDDFCEKHLVNQPKGRILAHRDNLYALPDTCPDVSGLNIVRLGTHLGNLKKRRFAPSYALAMSLTKDDFAQVIDMPIDDKRITKYLGGETFEMSAPDGYSLFCVEGFPLGFARIFGGRLKGRINGR